MGAAAAPAAPDVNALANAILRRPDILDALKDVLAGDGPNITPDFHSERSRLNRLQNIMIANNLVSNEPLGQLWWAFIERNPERYTAIFDRPDPVIPDGWRILGDILPIGPVLPEEWFVGGGYYLWQVYFNVPRFHHVGLKDLTYNDLLWGDDMGFLCDELEFGFDEHTSKIAFSMILRGYRFP